MIRLCRSFSTSVLPHSVNIFNNVNLSIPENVSLSSFLPLFEASYSHFKHQNHSGIWAHIPRSSLSFMHTLLDEPYCFDLHHVVPQVNSLVMTKWLHEGQSKLPPYTNHSAGAGGLVFNSEGAVLMVQERFTKSPKWKLPGGLVDLKENIVKAAERQIQEETGVQCRALGILGFREILNFRFGRSDLYFIVLCQAMEKHSSISLDPAEIAKAEWVPVSTILTPEFSKFQTFNLVAERMEKEMKKLKDSSQLLSSLKRRLFQGRTVNSEYYSGQFQFFELRDE